MRVARWLLPLVSLAIVLFITWWDFGGVRSGPGPLHSAHAAVAALANGSKCEACHRTGAGIDVAGCNHCHTTIGAQLASASGLHGSLPAGERERCGSCHGEHHGDAVPLIAQHAFARAGVADASTYDHRHVKFVLSGVHLGMACDRCHAHANDRIPPAGGRFIGLAQSCTSCHEDAHKGAYGADCASCHGQEKPWRRAPGFPHESFPLTDAHTKVECKQCHEAGTEHDVAALRTKPQPVRACSSCHADPHGGGAAAAKTLRLSNTNDCSRCHAATTWPAARRTPEQHAEFGFALRGAHAAAKCATCHGDAKSAPRWSGHAPELAACGACHEHPHRAELMAAAVAKVGPAQGCAGCHSDADRAFADGVMPPAMHAATGFPLEVPHADVACTACHKGEARAVRFPGRSASDCRACHADVHRGQFDLDARYKQCTACHQPTTFHPSRFGIAAHAATSFPLAGAHDAVACQACHKDVVDGVRRFRGTPSECAACHADVHKGAFDRAGRPRSVDGKTGCVRCHDATAFAPVVRAFDHALWTGYELTGAHDKVECSACHSRAAAVAGTAPTPRLGKVRGTRCADCHVDPHLGQFAQGGFTDCSRCHETKTYADIHFDHRTTRFPLDATHASVACGRCHVGYDTPQGKVVRYKPLGTTCGDCHKIGTDGKVTR